MNFLDYIRDRKAEDTFTRELEQAVDRARLHKEWEVEYMNWRAYEMDLNIDKRIAREEGLQEGREEGLQKGREEGLQKGREEGRQEGRQEGEYKQLIRLVCRKRDKGLCPEEAADQLESDTGQVREMYRIMDSLGTSDIDAVYRELVGK